MHVSELGGWANRVIKVRPAQEEMCSKVIAAHWGIVPGETEAPEWP